MNTIKCAVGVMLVVLTIITGCKKNDAIIPSKDKLKETASTEAYVVHASVRKLELIEGNRFNYAVSFWVTTNNDTQNTLTLPGKLTVKGELTSGGKTMPVTVELKPGSRVTHRMWTFEEPVAVKGEFSVPGTYQGKPIHCTQTVYEQPYNLKKIRVDGTGFADEGGKPFIAWGVNYCNPDGIPLMDDMWLDPVKWEVIKQDFREMKMMDLNVVRIHLQFRNFMTSPNQPNKQALTRLKELIKFCETYGIYLDITGLCSYFKQDPAWYANANEADRWAMQSVFWRAVATAAEGSNAVFAYCLINEPVTPTQSTTEWTPGEELGGYYFVNHLTREPAGRSWTTVTRQWIQRMRDGIKKHDDKTLITVGFIGLGPATYFNDLLDYNSTHIYPEPGKLQAATRIVDLNVSAKPLVIEETGVSTSFDEMRSFINTNRPKTAGFITHYFGQTIDQLEGDKTMSGAIWREWYKIFSRELNPYYGMPVH